MTWRLKDKVLQERLDSFSNGKFSKELEECADDIHSECIVIEFDKYGDVELNVYVRPAALEKIPEYNPNDWNKYPDITPPECVWMRAEMQDSFDKRGFFRKVGAIYKNGRWFNSTNEEYPSNFKVVRFRPWN